MEGGRGREGRVGREKEREGGMEEGGREKTSEGGGESWRRGTKEHDKEGRS